MAPKVKDKSTSSKSSRKSKILRSKKLNQIAKGKRSLKINSSLSKRSKSSLKTNNKASLKTNNKASLKTNNKASLKTNNKASLKTNNKETSLKTNNKTPFKANNRTKLKISNEGITRTGINHASKRKLFPIVAIGASAGGLEAYKSFLENLYHDTGMAFVIVQHLSPNYKSMLQEILGRETKMEVLTIQEGMVPAPNKIFVAPPTFSVMISKGIFHLYPRQRSKRAFMPIDIFMRSLAEDNMHYAIGVVMSGTDSDGVMGIEYIKSNGGLTFAQDKQSAKFSDMPVNAVSSGAVDFVMKPAEIALELKRISKNFYRNLIRNPKLPDFVDEADKQILKVLNILHQKRDIDFRQYKPSTLKRRILRRMLLRKIVDINSYIKFLAGNDEEVDDLCEDILINVTSFFRDPDMYDNLKKKVFPKLMKGRQTTEPIRIWITACSSGEEAYSMAIALVEYLGNKISSYQIQIFSTDLSGTGIEKARLGVYQEDISTDVSPERLRKFFIKVDSKYQINKSIRDMCVFAKQNLVQDPPFSKMDIISCRNVLIYLGSVLQNKVLPIFHYALKPKGYLVLGHSETVGHHRHLFETVDKKNRIYEKRPLPSDTVYDFNMEEVFVANLKQRTNAEDLVIQESTSEFQQEAETILLKKYAPAAIVVNQDLDILFLKGKTELYLELPQGSPHYNLLKMAKNGLGMALKYGVNEASKKGKPIEKTNIQMFSDKHTEDLNVTIEPFSIGNGKKNYFLIIFKPAETKKELHTTQTTKLKSQRALSHFKDVEIGKMQKELEVSRQHLQTVIEQQDTTNEELRSANEEIQSSNEELQSTNEELETTKEELQSTNEELITVNEELQNRNQELSYLNSDLSNLLSSIKISILMLDGSLRIKRFTTEAGKLLNLIGSDTGRKFSDINCNLDLKNIKALIKDVIDTPIMKEVDVRGKDDCWYSMKIRPYKTMENKIDGVIITFIDITEMKKSLLQQETSKREVEKLNRELENRVNERTSELGTINKNLEDEILDRKNAEASLRSLSKNLVDAQEAERLKLSRELHDSVNQILSAAKLKIINAETGISKRKESKDDLLLISDAKNYLSRAIDEVRRLSHNLRPASLDDIGIIPAINSLIDDFRNRNKARVVFSKSRTNKRLSPQIELAIYRMIQEGLHNIEKHSSATDIKISLTVLRNTVKLFISDNGKGFNTENHRKPGKIITTLGLIGLNERALSVGGKINIKSEKGLGTRIDVTIPKRLRKTKVIS